MESQQKDSRTIVTCKNHDQIRYYLEKIAVVHTKSTRKHLAVAHYY